VSRVVTVEVPNTTSFNFVQPLKSRSPIEPAEVNLQLVILVIDEQP
jgi:hypothetical protein